MTYAPDGGALGVMNYLEHNRRSWNDGVMSASAWAQPVGATTIAAARAGFWDVLLTPKTPVPKAWLSEVLPG